MSIQTFLGPILAGTQKNTNAVAVTSNTPSANYLLAGTGGSYRNTGTSDAFQFVSVPQGTLTAVAAASYPYTFTPVYSVNNVNYPICIPAGSYIDNIDFTVTTPFTFSGAPTSLALAIQLVGAPNSTYSTAQTIATATVTTSVTAGVYSAANSGTTASATSPLVFSSSATPVAMILNTGPTDALLQVVMTFTGGTNPAITAGAFSLMTNYAIRSPDGSWYPQTPLNPYSQPSPATY